jgi:hypothetical protein
VTQHGYSLRKLAVVKMEKYITSRALQANPNLIAELVRLLQFQVIERVLGVRPIQQYSVREESTGVLIVPVHVLYTQTTKPKEFSAAVANFYKNANRIANDLVRMLRAVDTHTLRTYSFAGYTMKGSLGNELQLELNAHVENGYIVQTAMLPISFVLTLERK